MLPLFLAILTALILAVAPPGWTEDDDDEIPFDEVHIFFELNDTDGDLGIHALIDGEPWKQLKIHDPHDNRMLGIWVNGDRLRRQGLTEIFFESAEPSFDELAPDAFFRRFPEGEYEVEGVTLDDQELEGEVQVTHLLPARPANIKISGAPAAEDCDAEDLPEVDDDEPVIIRWDPVARSHPKLGRTNEKIEVVKYQVVVEREEPTLLVFSVDLPPDVTEIEVPAGFIALGDAFKFEILVREASGNQTAVESCFEIEKED
jgi:hypothetical protein